jgi:hypothetical protein
MTDTILSTPRRGDLCANGATIIDIKRTAVGDGWIVLCLFPESQYHPYVTWWAYWSQYGKLNTSMGHYHDMLSDAIVDFDNRI